MQPQQRKIKALLCQTKPAYKQPETAMERVGISLSMYNKNHELDIILFPELTFTGYNFKDSIDALPFSCLQNEGYQFSFVRQLAIRLQCYIAFGYIQRTGEEGEIVLYNSAAVLDRAGNLICNYRKTHLYYNDKLWAEAGPGFKTVTILNRQGQKILCALGICNDINQKGFISGQFELAEFARSYACDVILFLTNWVDSEKSSVQKSDVVATYSYWLHRLSPLVNKDKTVLFLVSDRVGSEYDYFAKKRTCFYGSSCAFLLNPVKIIQNLGIEEEGYLLCDTYLPALLD